MDGLGFAQKVGLVQLSKAPKAHNVIAWANGSGKRRRRLGVIELVKTQALPWAITFGAVGALSKTTTSWKS